MKTALSFVAAVLVCLEGISQTWIKPADALNFNGKLVKVVGRITGLNVTTDNHYRAARLTMQANQDTPPLTLLIARRHRKHFDMLEKELLDEYVQVNGRISMRKGQPYIRLTSPIQFAIIYQAPEVLRFEPL